MPPEERLKPIKRAFDDIKNIAIENGFDVLIFAWGSYQFQYDFLKNFSEENSWHLLHSNDILDGSIKTSVHPKDGHPSKEFHKAVAEEICKYISDNELI